LTTFIPLFEPPESVLFELTIEQLAEVRRHPTLMLQNEEQLLENFELLN
jgi:hypothetical protein